MQQQALAMRRRGRKLILITDNLASAQALVDFGQANGEAFDVWIEVDTDGHRSGICPADPELLAVGRALHEGGMRRGGVLTHAGSSYELDTPEALRALAEQERSGCAERACPAPSSASARRRPRWRWRRWTA
jgi:D-serine deaminase-like pyridoxal phosphate-dependent protein